MPLRLPAPVSRSRTFRLSSRARRLLDDSQEFSKFAHSIIVICRRTRRLTHGFNARWLTAQLSYFFRHLFYAVRIRGDATPTSHGQGSHVTLGRGDRHNGPARRQNSIHLAGHHHAFQAPSDSNDVGVAGGQHGWNLVRWKKWQKPHILASGGGHFDLRLQRPVADERNSDSVALHPPGGANQRLPGSVKSQISRVHQD